MLPAPPSRQVRPISPQNRLLVESRKSAVRGLLAAARFPSPLIKPDVPFSSIRLSDRFHHQLTEVFHEKDAVHPASRIQLGPTTGPCPAKTLYDDAAGTLLRAHRRSDLTPDL